MKQKVLFAIIVSILFYTGCKTKKEDKKEGFFPALSFIKSQVAHVDTSLYQIIKQIAVDSTWDSTFIKREEFRLYAKDFLDLPDLTDKKYTGKYDESKFFDASLNRAIISLIPKDKNEEIQRQEITIAPGQSEGGEDKVKNIIIDQLTDTKDSTVIKRLLWIVDESFQVTTIIQKPGMPDSSQTMRISWQ